MTISLKHNTVEGITDRTVGRIMQAEWNQPHTLTMATGKLLGRTTAGTGSVEELSNLNTSFSFSNSVPSAWGSGYIGLEVGSVGNGVMASTTTGETYLLGNAYWNGTNWKYGKTDEATQVILGSDGTFRVSTAASGTAGNNITFAERFHIDNSGNAAVGATPSAWNSSFRGLEVGRAGNGIFSGTGAGNLWLVSNLYYASDTNFKYVDTAEAWAMNMGPGNGHWTLFYAASGTAGNTATLGALLSTKNNYSLALQGATYQSGTGITFPAAQNASTNVNTLDDYEEGTWTPTVTASSGSITTYSASGSYTKIGNRYFCTIDITVTTKGTAVGTMAVTMPATAGGSLYFGGNGIEINVSGKTCAGYLAPGSSTASWFLYDGTTPFINNGIRFALTHEFTV